MRTERRGGPVRWTWTAYGLSLVTCFVVNKHPDSWLGSQIIDTTQPGGNRMFGERAPTDSSPTARSWTLTDRARPGRIPNRKGCAKPTQIEDGGICSKYANREGEQTCRNGIRRRWPGRSVRLPSTRRRKRRIRILGTKLSRRRRSTMRKIDSIDCVVGRNNRCIRRRTVSCGSVHPAAFPISEGQHYRTSSIVRSPAVPHKELSSAWNSTKSPLTGLNRCLR